MKIYYKSIYKNVFNSSNVYSSYSLSKILVRSLVRIKIAIIRIIITLPYHSQV